MVNTGVELANTNDSCYKMVATNREAFVAVFKPLFADAKTNNALKDDVKPKAASLLLYTIIAGMRAMARAGTPAHELELIAQQTERLFLREQQ